MRALRPTRILVSATFTLLAVAPTSAFAARTVTWEVPSECVDPGQIVLADPPPNQPARGPALRVNVLLPYGYDGRRSFPVLYLLHGANSGYDYWLDWSNGELARALAGFPAIVVMPEGGMYGAWANLWNRGRRQACFEHYVLDELIPVVEERLRIRPGRRWHAVAGVSAGGLGAINLAAKKPGYFGQAMSFSGVLDIETPELENGVLDTFTTAFVDAEKLLELGPGWVRTTVYGDPRARRFYWTGHNPVKLAGALRHTRLYVSHGGPMRSTCVELRYDACVLADAFGLFEGTLFATYARRFTTAARSAGAAVEYKPHSGGHWYSYAARQLADAIRRWRVFEPVADSPRDWTYKTVSRTGDAWGLRFAFASPPDAVQSLARSGNVLRGEGSGPIGIRGENGCQINATLPFEVDLAQLGCLRRFGSELETAGSASGQR
jgi:diacylglycerol O-acyltransferase / trehalose O-mycolyltransferase